jgi:hypothetical protein
MGTPKSIQFSEHAREQMVLRGAQEEEIRQAIQNEAWTPATRGKWKAKRRFSFDKLSTVNQKEYKFKEVEPVFAEETEAIVVVTVLVYYTNEEATL